MKKNGFTLVELIVVITILSILGTIAFISLQGYSQSARDSKRLSDIGSMKKVLELYNLRESSYPDPTSGEQVTYSGSEVWTQGTFGDSVFKNVKSISEIPKDPLTNTEFTYSLLNTKKEYQLGTIIEGELSKFSNNKANAALLSSNAYITGNYNGKVAKVKTSTAEYILAVPSIISSDITSVESKKIENMYSGNKFVLLNKGNIPSIYSNYNYDTLSGSGELQVHNSSDQYLLYTINQGEELDNINKVNFIDKLQKAYSGTYVVNYNEIGNIIDLNILNTSEVENYASNLINDNLSNTIVISSVEVNYSCNESTRPNDNGNINYIIGTATSENQAYVQDATNCGYSCKTGFSGLDCSTAESSGGVNTSFWYSSPNPIYIKHNGGGMMSDPTVSLTGLGGVDYLGTFSTGEEYTISIREEYSDPDLDKYIYSFTTNISSFTPVSGDGYNGSINMSIPQKFVDDFNALKAIDSYFMDKAYTIDFNKTSEINDTQPIN